MIEKTELLYLITLWYNICKLDVIFDEQQGLFGIAVLLGYNIRNGGIAMQINWENFAMFNCDAQGICFKFEDLCRQLFANENISGNKQFKYLHANPNNHGLEAEPIYDETNKRWIGFQAKFFQHDVRYEQIKHSAEKIVEYYTGKEGIVELVFFFCNKPITSTSATYKNAIEVLKKANIEVQLITDTAILDLIREKYDYLGLYYFGNHRIRREWFTAHTSYILDELGERYNRDFNVDTRFSDELSLFIHDRKGAEFLNAKKSDLLREIRELSYQINKKDYLKTLEEAVLNLSDVSIETMYDSIKWSSEVRLSVKSFLYSMDEECKKLEMKRNEKFMLSQASEINQKTRKQALKQYNNLGKRIRDLHVLMKLPDRIAISERENQLLYGDILSIYGKAGIGKSHLLASKTQNLFFEKRVAMLLVAGIYYTDAPIHEQIMKNLRLDYSLEDLIDILETIGERDNCIVPIFIDALNETWNKKLWKQGLPSIIDKIKKCPMVKMILSYRSEYQKFVMPDSLMGGRGNTVTMMHRGFEDNGILAVKEFLNHYNIPFTPLEYFGYEMSNPLFLTLYCKTYNGEEVDLPTLYNRVIEYANGNISQFFREELRRMGYMEDDDILSPLIAEIAEWLVSHNKSFISKKDLIQLNFWTEFGFNAPPFIRYLVREHILHDSIFEGVEDFHFAYDQMNDYYCAKVIIQKCQTKDDVYEYLSSKILRIQNGELCNLSNVDMFVNACALYAEKYGEECIDIIDVLKDVDDKEKVFSRYINSFTWRDSRHIPVDDFIDMIKKYPCSIDEIWSMLIGNSVKVSHPLNADFLHSLLLSYKLNTRDYLWTIYINKFTEVQTDRIVQLIQMYDKGDALDITNEKRIELLLTLFGWILSSSNRSLRDYTSKAMIEILREHFLLSQSILEKFKDVDDPYIIQRLYGVVFGAYCKCTDEKSGQMLAEYVYHAVFEQEKVYPDILLREYARLIIERFLYKNPEYVGVIVRERIEPPYSSEPIPEIENQHYLENKYDGAMRCLLRSMRFEGMGIYGDFGRYVFQSSLHHFDVDDKKMFNYAIYYIQTELGLSEEYFGENDKLRECYDRFQTIKIERIGKKYQWIAMHNMLARISDHCKMINLFDNSQKVQYQGTWQLYIRDFDPTLNQKFMVCNDAPIFDVLDDFLAKGKAENETADIFKEDTQKAWLETKGIFLEKLKDTLVLTDGNGIKWVCLTKYCDTRGEDLNTDKLLVWSWLYAYFVSSTQANEISQCVAKGKTIITHDTSSLNQVSTIFNREYPWSPSCQESNLHAWENVQISTSGSKVVVEDKNGDSEIIKGDGQQEMDKEIGKMLYATTDLLWDAEYDATKEGTISISMPCARIIEIMELSQENADGFFYDANGSLAAFDTNLTQKINSVVVRKDILDDFLDKIGMKLVWIVDAAKEIHAGDYSISDSSNWEAAFIYERDNIAGEIRRIKKIENQM